jgi:hypothetical protein
LSSDFKYDSRSLDPEGGPERDLEDEGASAASLASEAATAFFFIDALAGPALFTP